MITSKISSHITEVGLSILLVMLLRLIGLNQLDILLYLINNIGTVLTVYGIFIALSCGLVVVMFNESDSGFIKWLIKNKAESSYRNAAIYTLSCFIFGMITVCLIKLYINNKLVSNIAMVVFVTNLIQAFTMIMLVNNYLLLKRKWQEYN